MDRDDIDPGRRRMLKGLAPMGLGAVGVAAVLREARPTAASAAVAPLADPTAPVTCSSMSVATALGNCGMGLDGVEGGITSYAGQTRPGQSRMRVSHDAPDGNGATHFSIVPYGNDRNGRAMGMALDYAGVVEAWCRDFSVHCNHQTGPVNDPARFWVGDEVDDGGLFATAVYGDGSAEQMHVDLAADRFTHQSHGSMRFIVRSSLDKWKFAKGPDGSETNVLTIDGHSGNLSVGPGQPWNVNLGAWGPQHEAGIAFGRAGDVRLYRAGPQMLQTDGGITMDGAFSAGPMGVWIGDGQTVALGRSGGATWGADTLQKQAWWGATPVVRPTGTPPPATDLASAIRLTNFLRATLLELGLIG
jgi:hypothetical protein